ncbi:MAG: isoprenylcysteine carboxylmethyltransferase family protein [bacterium]|nr:isoprenylcysteine carboxylmethyltransferase family protein [bacterium]
MNELTRKLFHNAGVILEKNLALNPFFHIAMAILMLCSIAILVSIAIMFTEKDGEGVLKKRVCPVSTFTMILVFCGIVPLLQLSTGIVETSRLANLFFFLFGALLMIGSTAANIYARYYLRNFWSDQIEIRENHRIVREGPYGIVRHPMYSSLIFFGIGIAFCFLNYIFLAIMLVLFIPMMLYRARSEEKEMESLNNEDYFQYREETGLLVPGFPALGKYMSCWKKRRGRCLKQ